ncbi:MAG: hypothetical protein AMXMBFR57_17700 [Acidimicrobiia bacterium]
MEPLLLRPLDAAKLLGISRSKVYELMAAGKLPSVTLGCSKRIPVDRLREWINAETK